MHALNTIVSVETSNTLSKKRGITMNNALMKYLTANIPLEARISGVVAMLNNNQVVSKSLTQEDFDEIDVFVNKWICDIETNLTESRFKKEEMVREILEMHLLVETIVEMNSLYMVQK